MKLFDGTKKVEISMYTAEGIHWEQDFFSACPVWDEEAQDEVVRVYDVDDCVDHANDAMNGEGDYYGERPEIENGCTLYVEYLN